jgi:hypothetical protein
MPAKKKTVEFTEELKCGHCANVAPMRIEHSLNREQQHANEYGDEWSTGRIHQLIVCPACEGVLLRTHFWHEHFEEVTWIVLYPHDKSMPLGLPEPINKAYEAALKVRSIDANAYGVLMRRMLEIVCSDRKATGNNLNEKLKNLASIGEIPEKLVGVAHGIRQFGNVGAHAELGDLTEDELPIVDALAKAVIEYVYSAPYLAHLAEDRFKARKKASLDEPEVS